MSGHEGALAVARTTTPRPLVGLDLQTVPEVESAVARFGERYLQHCYTPGEQRVLETSGAAGLAARFAAKEAVLKLLGAGGPIGDIDLRAIEVVSDPGGRPRVVLHGAAADLATRLGIDTETIDLSLTHDGGVAAAVAVALDLPDDRKAPR